MESHVVRNLDTFLAIIVNFESCTIRISESLLWRIPYVNSILSAGCLKTELVAIAISCRSLIQIWSDASVHRFLAPYQCLYVSFLWLKQSIVRSYCSLVTAVVLSCRLESDSVWQVLFIVIILCCRCLVQELRMCNLQTCCQDTIRIHEQLCTSIVLLW